MTSVSAGHIILTPTQPVGSGRPLAKGRQTYKRKEEERRLLTIAPVKTFRFLLIQAKIRPATQWK